MLQINIFIRAVFSPGEPALKLMIMTNASEWTGYLAMVLLVISFIPKQLKTVRIINLTSCIFFVAYGVLLGWEWPIIISNGLVASIQLYHLLLKKELFQKDKTR